MAFKFPGQYGGDLENIKYFLDRHVFPNPQVLKHFSNQLKKIDCSLTNTLESADPITIDSLELQREMVQKLAGQCHQMKVRKTVIDFAECAEELANSSPNLSRDEIATKASDLREKIDDFLRDQRPSHTNAKFLRFAKMLIEKAEKKEMVLGQVQKNIISLEHFQKPVVTQESYGIAEKLYELASLLYQENLEDFEKGVAENFTGETRKELEFHASQCEGNFNDLSDRKIQLRTIQGLLGYAHLLTDYYMDVTPYPTLVEIHEIFQDEELIQHLETSE